jgi:hypothetical protein
VYLAKIPKSTNFDSRDYTHDRLCTGVRRIRGLKRLKRGRVVPYVFCDQSKLSEGSIAMKASVGNDCTRLSGILIM